MEQVQKEVIDEIYNTLQKQLKINQLSINTK